MGGRKNKNSTIHCDFCKKSTIEVGEMVEGPGSLANGRHAREDKVWICVECVGLCQQIFQKNCVTQSVTQSVPIAIPDPRHIKAHLDLHIIGQEHAKRVMSVAVANHYKRFVVTKDDFMKDVVVEKSNILMCGPTGSGKAQPLYSAVYTPLGKKTMGDIAVGDEVLTPDGGVAKVIGVYPQGQKEIFRVYFANGDFVDACGDHLWQVDSKKRGCPSKIVDTKYILENAKSPNGQRQLSLSVPVPVAFAERSTILDPYLVGILLGEGIFTARTMVFSTVDDQILQSVIATLPFGYSVSKASGVDYCICKTKRNNDPNIIKEVLEVFGLDGKMFHDKHVPKEYLYNSVSSRLSVLQGLMDADGTVGKKGNVSFCSTSEKLVQDVKWLVESLGGICKICEKESFYTYKGKCKQRRLTYICHIRMMNEQNLFRLDRKRKLTRFRPKYFSKRVIDRVERLGDMEAKCIMVNHPDHLYLTDHFVVTHNTMLAKTLAKILKVPFAIGDATTMTEAGYVGEDVENLLLRLLRNADMDIEAAQRGILYVDEIDKIGRTSQSSSITRDVSGEGVQQSLLKMLEGTIAQVPPQGGRKHPESSYIPFDTTNVLFICGGTFVGLTDIVKKRIGGGSLGFRGNYKDPSEDELLRHVSTEDLVEFGLIPEFIGRLPVKTGLEAITEEALIRVLTEPQDALTKQYQKICHMDQVDLRFDDDALKEIAQKALKRKTGARALRGVIEEIMLDIMFDISDHCGEQIVITGELVRKTAV